LAQTDRLGSKGQRTPRTVCYIYHMNWLNSGNGSCHDNIPINIGIGIMMMMMKKVCRVCLDRDRSWEKREALLEIARREKLGLPLIDANFVDPSKINLPSDEELGDFEIIV